MRGSTHTLLRPPQAKLGDGVDPMTSTRPAVRPAIDARAASGRDGSRTEPTAGTRTRAIPLLWLVFLTNALVLAVALLLSGVEPRSVEGRALAHAFNAMLDRLEQARREATRTALAAQEAERLRVARQLHDEIGQTLTAVTIQAESAAHGDSELAQALRNVADGVRESLGEVRRIARELRPEALDDLGLVNALIALSTRIGAQGAPRVRRDLQVQLPPLSPNVELVIYRIAQESLTNALRHSSAREVTVSPRSDAEHVTLAVTDDGKGLPAQFRQDGAGIAGMRERALLVGGMLSLTSVPGQGTEVRLTIPIDQERA
jgi:two-component system, NarL family, sensor histidine kinase UhpB